ncbi:DUF481 domain-containing protein [Edwardsiella piscicida]|nr:DUF481 domain-containing protein [Edwardsiella piscicida]ADM42683.1 Putative exported protein [Edwardsiella tarda FL6-60]AGH74860.1 hypothetical protein ETAC_13695 [Edwardsiella piscicida C07-087]AOP44074.1 DUF481 domain-containing protein [Edwardsiella piscicida]ARD18919.1 hypothetical protein BXA22_11495 [Edwardsiella piscicida]EKS7768338.1 DUF481 domain-containing protein [Edwardsiella piscicida]
MLRLCVTRSLPILIGITAALYGVNACADSTLFTALDDPSTAKQPFTGNIQAGYNSQSGNSNNSSLLADTTMTWFNRDAATAYSLWGTANNAESNGTRSAEKYQAGARTRYNVTTDNYMFGQVNWLNDRFAGYASRTTGTAGYGRQIFSSPSQDLRVEFGPGIRHDEYREGGRSTRALAYGAANYTYQLTKNTQFTQGVSALSNEDTSLNSETALNVGINDAFSLRLSYNVTYNSEPPASAPKHTDRTSAITLQYNL